MILLKNIFNKSLNFKFFFQNFFLFDFKNLIFFFFSNLYFFYNFIFFLNKKFFFNIYMFFSKYYFYYFYNFLKYYIFSFCNFFFIEMFLDGLYYRIKYYKKYNVLSFILGFNHYILYYIPKNVFVKLHMKKRKFFLYSLDKLLLSQVCMDLVNLKYPNLFKGKGVKVVFYNYRLKILKKKK